MTPLRAPMSLSKAMSRILSSVPVEFALDGVRDEAARLCHAGHCPHAVFEVGGDAGNFRKGTAGAALHDPQVCAHPVHQQRGLVDESAIDAAHAHDNHEQHPDAHGGEDKTTRIVADVTDC